MYRSLFGLPQGPKYGMPKVPYGRPTVGVPESFAVVAGCGG